MSTIQLVVPPGQHAPFATVTDTDHRAWIIIATALGLAISLLSSAIRVSIRLTVSPVWGPDDATLAVASVSPTACNITVDNA